MKEINEREKPFFILTDKKLAKKVLELSLTANERIENFEVSWDGKAYCADIYDDNLKNETTYERIEIINDYEIQSVTLRYPNKLHPLRTKIFRTVMSQLFQDYYIRGLQVYLEQKTQSYMEKTLLELLNVRADYLNNGGKKFESGSAILESTDEEIKRKVYETLGVEYSPEDK